MNIFKTTLLLTVLTLLLVYGDAAIGGQGGMIFAFIMAMGMNFVSYFWSDKIVLKMYDATEVSEAEHPSLHQTVRRITQSAGLPMPKVYIIPSDQPNAFATGRNPEHSAVAVTRGILRILDQEELAGVLAHEIGHVKNRDILIGTVAATLAGAIGMLAHMAQWALIFGGGRGNERDDEGSHPVVMILMMILAPIAAMLVQMAISRTREYSADRTGASLIKNPDALARALEKLERAAKAIPMESAQPATAHMFIVSPLTAEGVMGLFSTHPPMEKRIEALRAMRPPYVV
ncbi:MAG: zinc metalloprotease HtpX [Nitrospinae bacterium]|nr:zinc metalloprotease HtpX [Nitrospinota bacterium]